jgi:hypothetical protein
MEEKKVFEVPVVTTYDKEELEVHTAFTGGGSGGGDSDSHKAP